MIGLYELLGNPTTYPIEPPGSLGKMHVVYANIDHSFEIADAAVSQSNRRYYNKPIVHHYGKSIVVQKDKNSPFLPSSAYFVSDHRYLCCHNSSLIST